LGRRIKEMSREEKCLRVVGTVHFGSGEITPPVLLREKKMVKSTGKLKYQSGKNEYSILNVKTKNISKLEVDKDVEEVVSNSPYFKKLKLVKKLDELNTLGMDDQTIAGTLGMDIRTIRMFRESPESMRPTTLERILLGVDEIKKQLEELRKQT